MKRLLFFLLFLFKVFSSNAQESSFFEIRTQSWNIEMHIQHIKQFMSENNVNPDLFVYLPIYNSSVLVNDSILSPVSEIIIVEKKNLKFVGAYLLCTDGITTFYFNKSKYGLISTMPCRVENRYNDLSSELFHQKPLRIRKAVIRNSIAHRRAKKFSSK